MSIKTKANNRDDSRLDERDAPIAARRSRSSARLSDARRALPARRFFAVPEDWDVEDEHDREAATLGGFFASDLLDAEFDRWETNLTAATDLGGRMIARHVEAEHDDDLYLRP